MQVKVESIPFGKPEERELPEGVGDRGSFGARGLTDEINKMYAEGWRLVNTEWEFFDKEVHGQVSATSVLFLFYEKE